jgi:ABC-2 type transport system permease protein
MTAYVSHLAYDFRAGMRDRAQMLMNYIFPLFFYAMIGALMTGINPNFTQSLIPAMIAVGIMTSTLLGMPSPLVAAREAGIFRSFKINGVPALNILSIPVVSSLMHTAIISAIITLTAKPFFKGVLPSDWVAFILTILLTTFAMAGIGMLIGVIASGARTTVLYGQIFFLPSMMLSGMMFPTSMLPPALYRLALLLPATHAMNAWNALAYGQKAVVNPYASLAALAASGLIAFGLAAYLFNWDSHNTRRRATVAIALLALAPYALFALGIL